MRLLAYNLGGGTPATKVVAWSQNPSIVPLQLYTKHKALHSLRETRGGSLFVYLSLKCE